ncbi:hypothetical protein Tsubulata_033280 [Turnera subulata]|uniref:B box-type domain-containing protein n=1 Tax=Turnera subulata TaxID=218843 RepID=A0A9Q0J143_9ROSI|nr:hypothetical protein Tsubulata_033280 [Turnera subulata]
MKKMKIQCDVCEKAEAEVLCCADEAVLCSNCDAKVHTANKVSQKHQRVFFIKHPTYCSSSSPSHLPLCDACQERKGYVFCLEDRALLCKNCDVSTHAGNPYALSHQRFLISDTKVTLQSSSTEDDDNASSNKNHQYPARSTLLPMAMDFPSFECAVVEDKESMASMASDFEAAASTDETAATFPDGLQHFPTDQQEQQPHWPILDDIYNLQDFSFYEFSEVGSTSKD